MPEIIGCMYDGRIPKKAPVFIGRSFPDMSLGRACQRSTPSWALTRSRKSREMHHRLAIPTTV